MPRRIAKAEREASPMLDYMKMNGIPLTRQAYLDLSMPGMTEDDIGSELECEVPAIFQRGYEPKPRRKKR